MQVSDLTQEDGIMTDHTPIWFITGSSSGLGLALAKAVFARGWRAVLAARRPEELSGLASAHGERALALQLDVTDPASVERAVVEAETRFGRIDVLANAAGYGYLAVIEEGEDEGVRAQFETNVFGLLAVTKRVLPGTRAPQRPHRQLLVVGWPCRLRGYRLLPCY